MTDLNRREFVGAAAALLASTALPGCAGVAAVQVAPSNGAVRLALREFPQLARAGGFVKVVPNGAETPIYVLAREDGGYTALSPICTHRGCTVDVEGPQLVCPCHGATYDRAGRVLRGPAEEPLRSFPLTATPNGELVIQLESRS